ncbi:MAG: hypothetical protein A2145_02010 [candidate division Zixibacteria bacterium RBG_16_40_9]|nr:MAG: hypothetical protein A2145_02010 [candidate division Zixibacteria bacterium RBG_16_40_9]
MGFTGNLKTVPFPDILQLISTGKKTGRLKITRQHQSKEIFFKNGNIIFATSSNIQDDLLGNLLLKKGKISKYDLDKAINMQETSGKKIGMILQELKVLKPDEVEECLKVQIEEVIFSLFTWDSGEFGFQDNMFPPENQFITELDTMNVIMEGTRRIDEWVELKKILPGEDKALKITSFPKVKGDEIVLTLDEFQVLNLINGERTLPEILQTSVLGEFITSKAVHKLMSKGLVEGVEIEGAPRSSKKEEESLLALIAKAYSGAFQVTERAIQKKLGAGKYKILNNGFSSQRSLYPVLGSFMRERGHIDPENFVQQALKLPKELRLWKLLAALNSLLTEYLKLTAYVLGENVLRQIAFEIRKEVAVVLLEQTDLVKKYDLETEIYKTLKAV